MGARLYEEVVDGGPPACARWMAGRWLLSRALSAICVPFVRDRSMGGEVMILGLVAARARIAGMDYCHSICFILVKRHLVGGHEYGTALRDEMCMGRRRALFPGLAPQTMSCLRLDWFCKLCSFEVMTCHGMRCCAGVRATYQCIGPCWCTGLQGLECNGKRMQGMQDARYLGTPCNNFTCG